MPRKITSLVVDDEPSSRENLTILLEKFCLDVEVVGVAATANEAEAMIKALAPQLIFLDIQLGVETGFDLLRMFPKIEFEIIFVTAHDHYALKAFEFMAVDYLLKPIKIPQLVRAVYNAKERIENKSLTLSLEQMMMHVDDFNRDRHKIALAVEKGYKMIYISQIMYCSADGSYTHFYLKDEEPLVVSKNLKYYEKLLEGYGFERSHISTLVNLRYVSAVEKKGGGALVMENGKQLPVSRAKRQELESKIKGGERLL